MFELIFGTGMQDTIVTVAVIAAIVAIFYFFNKFKPTQALVGIIAFCALVISALFSFGHLNIYYSAKGGTFGAITSILKKNEVVIEEKEQSIDFSFKNVMLMKNATGKYSASITSTKKLKLDANESYFIYVNEQPCTTVSCEERDIYATYSYTFLNRDAGEYLIIADDVMTFYFAFYDNYSYLYIEIEDGETTNQLWNQYFNKNDFKVKIVKVPSSYYSKAEYKTVNIYANDSLYRKAIVRKGSVYKLPDVKLDGFRFEGWTLDRINLLTEKEIVIENNINIYGVFKEETTVIYFYDVEPIYDMNSNVYAVRKYTLGEKLSLYAPNNPNRNLYSFVGWSTDGVNIIDLSNTVNDGTITSLYGVWKANYTTVKVDLNGGTMEKDGVVYNDNFTIKVSNNEKIILPEPTKEGYIFDCYGGMALSFDKTFNLSILELEDIGNMNELNLKVFYYPMSNNVDNLTDNDLKMVIERMLFNEIYGQEFPDNETFIRDMYEIVMHDTTENMSLFEVEQAVLEIYEISANISEDITTREFLEIIYGEYSSPKGV